MACCCLEMIRHGSLTGKFLEAEVTTVFGGLLLLISCHSVNGLAVSLQISLGGIILVWVQAALPSKWIFQNLGVRLEEIFSFW